MNERRKEITINSDMSFWGKTGFTIKREVAAFILIIAWIILVGILGRIILQP